MAATESGVGNAVTPAPVRTPAGPSLPPPRCRPETIERAWDRRALRPGQPFKKRDFLVERFEELRHSTKRARHSWAYTVR